METKNLLFHSIVKHFDAKRAEALAALAIIFDNPSPSIQEEAIQWTKQLAESEIALQQLNKHFLSEELITEDKK